MVRSPLGEVAHNIGGWFQVLFTLINSLFGVRKPDGSKYEHNDYILARDAYFGKNSGEQKQYADTHGDSPGQENAKAPAAPKTDHYVSIAGVRIGDGRYVFNGTDLAGCEVQFTKSGGSEGWRTNNPGLIKDNDIAGMIAGSGGTTEQFMETFGVLGKDENGVLIFKDMVHGLFANMYGTQKNYDTMTVADAIAEMADGTDNDAYFTAVTEQLAHIDACKKISELEPAEMGQFMRVAAHIKGMEEGTLELTAGGRDIAPETREQLMRDQGANLLSPNNFRPGNTPQAALTPPAPGAKLTP